MKFIKTNGRDLNTVNIESIETRRKDLQGHLYEVIYKMNSGTNYIAFSGTKPACDDFRVAILTTLTATSVNPPAVNWVDIEPNTVTVEKGKLFECEMLWNGVETESHQFTYETANLGIAEFVLGDVVGIEHGRTVVSANKDGKKGNANVNVIPSKDNIMFDHLTTMQPLGGAYMISLERAGVPIDAKHIHFTSVDPRIATVSANGAIDTVGEGFTVIIGMYAGVKYGHICEVRAAREEEPVELKAEVPKKKSRKKKEETVKVDAE